MEFLLNISEIAFFAWDTEEFLLSHNKLLWGWSFFGDDPQGSRILDSVVAGRAMPRPRPNDYV
jgi:hypothetical protein